MKRIVNDPHTFIVRKVVKGIKCTLILPIYVDDLLPIGDKVLTDEFEAWIPEYFNVTLMGDASLFLGLRITRNRSETPPSLSIDQSHFATAIVKRFEASNHRRFETPLSQNENLVPNETPKEEANPEVVRAYQRAIGSLMYLMLGTRPDLAYAVGKLARFSSHPSPDHIVAISRVLAYVNTYPALILKYIGGGDINPEGYIDADFAGDTSDRKSTAGYTFLLNGTAFSWSSKKEPTVATSTMEAEYIALYLGAQHAAWIWHFYSQLGFPFDSPIDIYSDSEAAIAVAKAEQSHKRSKHLDVKLHATRERITNGEISVRKVPTEDNCADMFTKSLRRDLFKRHTNYIGLEALPDDVLDTSFYDDAPES